MSGRKDFLSQPAPENYVAGLGRGATGFTTRSDLGPAREGPNEEQLKEAIAKRAAAVVNNGAAIGGPPSQILLANGLLTSATSPHLTNLRARRSGFARDDDTALAAAAAADDDDDDRYQDVDNEYGLFAGGAYDRDDGEADRIYKEVDERMNKRRKAIREAREKKEREEFERNNPKIQQQFADLKRALSSVTDEQWSNIPEVGDLTRRNRRQRQNLKQRYYAVPDSVIASARDADQYDLSISSRDDGTASEPLDGSLTNFVDIGAAREKALQVRLDQAGQNSGYESVVGTASIVDPMGYLTSLTKSEFRAEEFNIGEIKRVRRLLKSVTKTNPKHGPGWRAAARLEQIAGRINEARKIIALGCEHCPKDVDVWLESIQMNENQQAKVIAANALLENDRSVDLWVAAMNLENSVNEKKKVIRHALDNLPQSVRLWKEAVNLEEDSTQARLLLAAATEVIPLSVELWLALARLETRENAQIVLNKARKAIPTSHEIWLAGCRLQEQMNNEEMVRKIMERAVKSLKRESAMLKREEWISEAEKCEEEAVLTCRAIITETIGWELDEDNDRLKIWLNDASSSIKREKYETARAIYAHALRVFPREKVAWLAAVDLEKSHGSKDALWTILERAVDACPHSEELWLQLAKEKWQSGEMNEARRVLGKAFQHNPNNENIWLAAVKLEADHGEHEQAQELLATARREAGGDRVWIKSVTYERQLGNSSTALDLVNQALNMYPKSAKLWMQKGQIYQGLGQIQYAREAFLSGTRSCPKNVSLWLLASRLDEQNGQIVKARSLLERANLAIPKTPQIWCESVRLERRSGNIAAAHKLIAQAIQEIPNSGLLWSERIWNLESRTQRKPLAIEAIKRVNGSDDEAHLFVVIARIFWSERRLDKAMNWFEKAILLQPDWGDAWAWFYAFLRQHGTPAKQDELKRKLRLTEPRHGEIWQSILKDPRNARLDIDLILQRTAERLTTEV